MAASILLPVTVVGYIVGIVLAIVRTVYRSNTARRLASVVFALTWLFHTASVIREGVVEGRLPLANMAEYLLVLGWIVLTLHLYGHFIPWDIIYGLVLFHLYGYVESELYLFDLCSWCSIILKVGVPDITILVTVFETFR